MLGKKIILNRETRNVKNKNLVSLSNSRGKNEFERLDYLDGWRGLAIAFVLYSHFAPSPEWFDSGRFGVDIFFSLSGFLMSSILFEKRISLCTFYKRRISRVFPVFILYVIMVYLIYWYIRGPFSYTEFFSTLFFLRTYLPATPNIWHTGIPIGHLWSLNAEEHCYVFLSLLTIFSLLKGREGLILIGIGILSIVIQYTYIKVPTLAPTSGALGTEVVASHLLISAGYFLIRHQFVKIIKPWMPVAAFGAAIACHTNLVPWYSHMIASPFLLAFALNHLSEAPKHILSMLACSGIRLLGIWSFSIYLWQQPFYSLQSHFFPGVAFAMAMTVALFSFYFFENPIRSWLNRNW